MKVLPRNMDEWHEIHAVMEACKFHREVFESQVAELRRLMPEFDESTVSDIANGLITLIDCKVKESEATKT